MRIIFINKSTNHKKGFTLVEAVIGTALFMVVFGGIFGAYRLGLKVVGVSKNRIIATSVANAQIEKIRNLTYESVGIKNATLPFAAGVLDQNSTQTVGSAVFNISTSVRYIADSTDSVGDDDPCDLDYKKADVIVSWGGGFGGHVSLSTNISPKNQVQELQSCQDQPGGVLAATVFDDHGILVPSPNIGVYDPATENLVAQAMPASGRYLFPLAAGTYRVEVSKAGYSNARTYGTDEIAVPNDPNPAVFVGDQTPASLSIDLTSSISVDGVSPNGQDNFSDTFEDQSKISDSSDIQIVSGDITLSGPPYAASGYAVSSAITPINLVVWDELRFNDTKPALTDIFYQILYYDGINWVIIPDLDLGGNSAGFKNSPVNLAGLDKDIYPQIKIKTVLSTNDPDATSAVHNWQVIWTTDQGVPVPGAAFHTQGSKTIGEDAEGQKVYKYSQDLALDGQGHLDITGIDGDAYTFSVNPANGFDLIGIYPESPVSASAGGTVNAKLFLRSQNALLITAQNSATYTPIFSATVRLVNAATGYDKTQHTDQKGQTYLAPLENGTYEISVSAAGFDDYSGQVLVSGASSQMVDLHQQE